MTAPSRNDWQQALGLLDVALDLGPVAQAEWLRALPAAHAPLAPLLEELLRSHAQQRSDAFMRTPALDAVDCADPVDCVDSLDPLDAIDPLDALDPVSAISAISASDALGPLGARATTPPRALGEVRQRVVGPYRLLRQIGEGGMASVWLAERSDGLLSRRIALKLPHVAWGGASFADRMARERNILASLTHPNIARLYDAGIAADGRPYLALEFVDGHPIDVYAGIHLLDTRQRVALVVEVARAVAYAHAHLVVHRDLKPSNILVDAEGHAHLLDFGIARLVDAALTEGADSAAATLAAGRALTPDYASPEQIRGDPMGTASDTYSLGVVSFELLAGVRPYRLKKGLGAAALALAIAETDAARPSDVATDPTVARQLRGDLDAIVGRALTKASAERYATVDAFADDLERHLRGEPVQARPDSPGYRAERWVRRHKLETAIAAAVLAAILGGAYAQVLVALALGAGATAAWWQRNRAVEQARLARVALDRAEQVKAFIASIFTQAVPRTGQGGQVTAHGLLQAATLRVETDLAGQPDVAAELGALIGASFNELGEMQAGLTWLPRAVELCMRAFGPSHPLTLQTRWRLVEAANSTGDLGVSEPLLPALVRDVRSARPPEHALQVVVLRSHAFVLTKRGRESDAMAALHEAVEVAATHLGDASAVTLATRAALSNTCKHFGHDGEALRVIEPALEVARAEFGQRRPHGVLLAIERAYADALARNHRPHDAVVILRQVLRDQRSLDAGDTERVRVVMSTLAQALTQCGRLAEAEASFAEADALHRRLCPGVNDEGISLAVSRARVSALAGHGPQALAHIAEADAASVGRSEAVLLTHARDSMRALAQATAGLDADALAGADLLLARGDDVGATVQARALCVRAAVLRRSGAFAAACEAAERGALVAEGAACADLESGLMFVEAARCHRAVGDDVLAGRWLERALRAWQAGQVDGAALHGT